MNTAESAPAGPDEPGESYQVATDGACKGNPGPTGWAWVGEDGEWAAGSLLQGTNNVGELLALLAAIRDNSEVPRLTILADSRYVIDTYLSWMDGHARRGWVTAAKKPTANRDLLEQLIAARQLRRDAGLPDVRLVHVRGHAGHVLNSWADERAVRAAAHGALGEELIWSSRRGLDRLDVSEAPSRRAPRM